MADPIQALKDGAKMLWAQGDYRRTAAHIEPDAEALVARCHVRPGMRVLDVAAGTGNFAIAAARAGAQVLATDLTPQMVEWGRERSAREGLAIEWREADAEALPVGDGLFDMVGSTFGAQFAPRPQLVAGELFRVLKPGGQVAMANWTADGFSGRLTAEIQRYAPPSPVVVESPMAWGDPQVVRHRFQRLGVSIETEVRVAKFGFESVATAQEFFIETNPALLLLARILPEPRYAELLGSVRRLVKEHCRSVAGGIALDNEYLVVLARKS